MAQTIQSFSAEGYDSHVELNWKLSEASNPVEVFASVDGGKHYTKRGETSEEYFLDFVTDMGRNLELTYYIRVKNGKKSDVISATVRDFTDEELLEMVQQYTFRYFYDYAEGKTGMARERSDSSRGDIVTSGGSGFGVMAIIVGVERGYITREKGVQHLLKLTSFLAKTDRFHGMWAHWYAGETQKSYPFSQYDDGGDVVESAFMAQGLLTARQYFDAAKKDEKKLRDNITRLWESMEWDFYTRGQEALYWHWSKNHGWKMNHAITGYNECLIAFVLAAASPTHSIKPGVYHNGWASPKSTVYNYKTYYNMSLPMGNPDHFGGPLFFAHYSFLGLDPRGLSDRYANYWEQNRRHTLINRAYCIDNPKGYVGYGEDFWGLTASDKVPEGYMAHAPGGQRDVGTITPTAALSSMPYAPEEAMKVLKNLYRNHGKEVWGPYGFYDAINLSLDLPADKQVRQNYLAIDQGPILIMIENYRSGLLWKYFMKNQEVRNGLKKLGFKIHGQEIQ
ncbi:beta-glucosidase [Marinilabiliaceae bacterium JC017]|nr:beta-glucosidase [Marinilabiliaceae bacterium JC017]